MTEQAGTQHEQHLKMRLCKELGWRRSGLLLETSKVSLSGPKHYLVNAALASLGPDSFPHPSVALSVPLTLDPQPRSSSLLLRFFPSTGPVNSELFLRHVPGWLRPLLRPLAWLVLRAPRGGAQTPLYCALQEGIEPLSGRYFANCHVEEVPPAARDDRAAHRLWEASRKLAGFGPGEDAESDEDSLPEDPGTPSSPSSPHPEEPTASELYPRPQNSTDRSTVTRRIPVKAELEPQAC